MESDGKSSWEDKIRRKCKYYFDLNDIFMDRAANHPKATSDGITEQGFLSGHETDDSSEVGSKGGDDVDKQVTLTTPAKASKKNPPSTTSSKKRKKGPDAKDDDNMLDRTVAKYLRHKMEVSKPREEESEAAKIAKLAGHWKSTVDCLDGDRVMAASLCSDFERFLNKEELGELNERKTGK